MCRENRSILHINWCDITELFAMMLKFTMQMVFSPKKACAQFSAGRQPFLGTCKVFF